MLHSTNTFNLWNIIESFNCSTSCDAALILSLVHILYLSKHKTWDKHISLHMTILMCRHLWKSQYCILTTQTVVMCLFSRVSAWFHVAWLRGREFFKASSHDGVKFLMLASMSHNFICISAHKVTLQTMKVWCFVLHSSYKVEQK